MKNVFKLAAALSVGLTVVSGAAKAGVYNVTLKPVSGNATGSYHVTLKTFWDGSVRLTNGAANGGLDTPNNQIMNVRVQFFDAAFANFAKIVKFGGFAAGANALTTPGGAWTSSSVAGGNFGEYQSPKLSPKNIQTNGSNVFKTQGSATGEFTAQGAYQGILIRFNSQKPVTGAFGGAYDAFVLAPSSVVPEASSIALMLPALLPLGIALRRRSKTRK